MASPRLNTLTGDPEIDACVPQYPKLLPEITWLTVSATRIMPMGGLTAPLFPAKVKCVSLLEFIGQLDGRHALADLLGAEGELDEARRYYLRNLFQHGLLEAGAGPATPPRPAEQGLPAFLARTLDQTRLSNQRSVALAHAHRPLYVSGLSAELQDCLREAGLQLTDSASAAQGHIALLGIQAERCQSAEVDALLAQGLTVIPIHIRPQAVDIGPLLARQGGSQYADYRAHFLNEMTAHAPASGARAQALAALTAQLLLLLCARTSPIMLGHAVTRLQLDDNGPRSERLPLVRAQHRYRPLDRDSQARLERHARISVPALRYVGTKAHEIHYSPKNLAAAREVPAAAELKRHGGERPSRQLGTRRLLGLIERAFGYRAVKGYGPRRLCPTGGNLGSPECLVLIKRDTSARLYRYIPLQNQLEWLMSEPLSAPQAEEQIQVLCLGNREKTTRKYNEFGENLACIDAGVALAYFKASAQVCGVQIQIEDGDSSDAFIARVLTERSAHYRLMWSATLTDAGLGQRLMNQFSARRNLDKNIAARHALRHFAPEDLSAALIEDLLIAAMPGGEPGRRPAILSQMSLIALIRAEQGYQLHVLEPGAERPALRRLSAPTLERCPPLFMQTQLSHAPVQLFFLSPLHQVLAAHGAAGHDISLSLAGEWVAKLWLGLAEQELAGCPCGASVEDELVARLPAQYAEHYTLFSFVIGAMAR